MPALNVLNFTSAYSRIELVLSELLIIFHNAISLKYLIFQVQLVNDNLSFKDVFMGFSKRVSCVYLST